MLWTTQGYGWYVPLRVMSSRIWMVWTTKHCEWYEWLDISWAKASRCYEKLRVVDDMNDYASRAKGGGWHECLWVMSSWLKILWTTQGCGWHERIQVVSLRLRMLWAAQSCRWYEQLRIPWAQATRYLIRTQLGILIKKYL